MNPTAQHIPQNSSFDILEMLSAMENLLAHAIYDSAQILGDFILSLINNIDSVSAHVYLGNYNYNHYHHALHKRDTQGPAMTNDWSLATKSRHLHAVALFFYAESIFGTQEYIRALRQYDHVLHLLESCAIEMPSIHFQAAECEIQYKIASCHMQNESFHCAIEALCSIAERPRSLKVNLMLGKLYRKSGLVSQSESCYMDALSQNPFAIEAAVALSELANTSSSNCSDSLYTKFSFPGCKNLNWMHTLANAHTNMTNRQFQKAEENWNALSELFPKSLHISLHKAKCLMERRAHSEAQIYFRKARQIDPNNMFCMDFYAESLRKSNRKLELSQLTLELFEVSETHAIPWLVAAYHSESKCEYESALHFAERALSIDQKLVKAYLIAGQLHLELNQLETALTCFATAHDLQSSMNSYAGLIHSYCEMCLKGLSKYKEALAMAKAAVQEFPEESMSFTLLGNVLALREENRMHAKKAYERALSMDDQNMAAMFGLLDLEIAEKEFVVIAERLTSMEEEGDMDKVHVKLGGVYAQRGQFAEAMVQYQNALHLNSLNAEAQEGMNRLDEMMREQGEGWRMMDAEVSIDS